MRRIVAIVLVLLATIFFTSMVSASMIIQMHIGKLTDRAQLIVQAVVVDKGYTSTGKVVPGVGKVAGQTVRMRSVAESTLKIIKVLKNTTTHALQPGDEIEYSYVRGINTARGLIRPSVRPCSVEPGEEAIFFFGQRGDNRFILGVDQGLFEVKDGMVSNSYMKTTMFKGLKMSAPGVSKALRAGKVNVGAPEAEMELNDFNAMVESLVEGEGGASQ